MKTPSRRRLDPRRARRRFRGSLRVLVEGRQPPEGHLSPPVVISERLNQDVERAAQRRFGLGLLARLAERVAEAERAVPTSGLSARSRSVSREMASTKVFSAPTRSPLCLRAIPKLLRITVKSRPCTAPAAAPRALAVEPSRAHTPVNTSWMAPLSGSIVQRSAPGTLAIGEQLRSTAFPDTPSCS